MLDFLPLSFTLGSHRPPVSCASSCTSDGIPHSSFSDHGAYDATTVPPVMHIASPCKIQQADFTAQASLRSPPSLFTQFGEWNHSIQYLRSSSGCLYLSSSGNKSRSPSSSSIVARKGLGRKKEAVKTPADWSQSESEPINVGIVLSQSKQKMDPVEPPISSFTRRPASAAQRQPPVQPTPKTPSTSRFPFFSRSTSVQESSPPGNPSDELINLNIQASLFPTGQADPYSPAAFNSLVQNAERLLSRLQTAYKDCTVSLHEIATEKETQAEELEGCQMRARHLKMQLDNMTAKLAEQDKAMMSLVDELAQEKQLQQQEQGTPKRSARPTTTARTNLTYKNAAGNTEMPEARRGSDISTLSVISDSGFESDEESPTNRASLKHQDTPSPSVSVSSASTTNSRDSTHRTNLPPPTISYPPATAQPPRPKPPPAWAPGLFPTAHRSPASASTLRNPFDRSCSNCQGARASEAWNVVNVLKDENRGLKERIGHLESSVDGCLDLVTGMIAKERMTT